MGILKHKTKDGDFVEYIGPVKLSEECKDIADIKNSPEAKSCTTFIKTIKLDYNGEEYLICDSPGLEDTRGAELDVANILGVIKAAQACKKILPIIVISKNSLEEKLIGLRNLGQNIAQMFKSIDQIKNSFQILFTKFENDKEKENFRLSLANLINELTPEERSNKNFDNMIKIVQKQCQTLQKMKVVHPLKPEERLAIMEKLSDVTKISNPENVFKMQLSNNSREAIRDQMQMNTSLILTCLNKGKFDIV